MAYLSEEQLLLLEELTYLSDDVSVAAESNQRFADSGGQTLSEIFQDYNTAMLRNKEGSPDKFDPTYAEWADIIDAIRSDPVLSSLTLTNDRLASKDGNLAYVYVDKKEPDKAIVTFKGTTGADEWKDDLYSGGVSDTPIQRAALDFVENLPYRSITSTGHSKGGNKAQYVALLSNKVERCVSFDGEGFSDAFLEKYGPLIAANAYKLHCYANEYDYVHELMNEIPGADYHYIKGKRMDNFAIYHAPHTMMRFRKDADGNPQLYLTEVKEESKEVQILRDLADYLLQTTQDNGDWETLDPFVEDIISIMLAGTQEYSKGTDGVIRYINDHPESGEMVGLLLAYVAAYIRDSGRSPEDVKQLLAYLGVTGIAASVLVTLIGQLQDSDDDPIIRSLIHLLGNGKIEELGLSPDLVDTIWNTASRNYRSLPTCKPSKWRDPPVMVQNIIYDFTAQHYAALMCCFDSQRSAAFPDFNALLGKYSWCSWYSGLRVGAVISHFADFCNGITALNSDCRARLETVFQDAEDCDRQYASVLPDIDRQLQTQKMLYERLRDAIQL